MTVSRFSTLFLLGALASGCSALDPFTESSSSDVLASEKLTVAAGDTVTFTNEDSAPHTATAGDGSFDTGRLNKGASATVTIAGAGNHAYKCNFHASMKGTISAN